MKSKSFFEIYKRLFAILSVALIVRLVVLIDFYRSIFWKVIRLDSATYNNWAHSIIQSGDWIGRDPFFMTPLYPYLLAFLYNIFGDDIAVVRIFQIFISVWTVSLIYFSAKNLFSNKTALISGIIAALYGPFILFTNLLFVETVKIFFVSLALFILTTVKESNVNKNMFLVGLVIGFSSLCRASDMLLLIVAGISIMQPALKLSYRLKRLSFLMLGFCFVIIPVTVRNYVVSDEFVLITSNGGINFYIGNNEKATGLYNNSDKIDISNDPNGSNFLEVQYNRKFNPSEASSFWYKKATDYIFKNPLAYSQLFIRKCLLFINSKEIGQLGYGYDYISSEVSKTLKYLIGFIFVFPFSVIGIGVLWRERKRYFILYGFLIAEVLSVVLFFITDRFRLSSLPMLIILSSVGIIYLYEQLVSQRYTKIIILGGIVLLSYAMMTVLNITIPPNFTNEFYNVGKTYFDEKKYIEALESYKKALVYSDAYQLRNSIGDVYAAMNYYPLAIEQYKLASAMNPMQSSSMFSIGSLFARQQQFDSAVVYFEKTKIINRQFAPAYLNVGLCYWYMGNFKEAYNNLKQYLILEPNSEKSKSIMSDLVQLEQIMKQK